ncbi:MAG: hypothetical protein LC775_06165, partial [Acidobacteria bacterium]|nr:hypothetical protein [Acidobacteriota bacterium]
MTDTLAECAVAAHQLAEGVSCWLDAAREYFALPTDISPDQLHPDEDMKPLGELVLAGSIAIREGTTSSRQVQTARALIEFAWQQLRSGQMLYDLQCEQLVDTYPMEIYACFVRAGYRHQRLDELLTHLSGLRAARVPEVIPSRALAVLNAERLIGLSQHDNVTTLTARTWLGGTPEPWTTDFFTQYAITHTVFHLTDWGAYLDGLPVHLQTYLYAWLPAWVEVYLEAAQWDLVGELLVVDLCLTQPNYYPHAWKALV